MAIRNSWSQRANPSHELLFDEATASAQDFQMSTSQDTDKWLSDVYHAENRDSLERLYDRWAETYDSDLIGTGYLHTSIITGLVCRHVKRKDAAILDAGVGTGGTGAVLNLLGYNNLTGLDMSEGMLEKARTRECYVDLQKGIMGEKLDFLDRSFDAVISTGTFTLGHAPASAFDELVRILEKDGVLMFSVGTSIWEEMGFKAKLDNLTRDGSISLVDSTPIYRPMPYSPAERDYTTRALVYKRVN
jgi:predicted TPR repeat methyltransferase